MLTPHEQKLAQHTGFDQSVLIILKQETQAELSQLRGIDLEDSDTEIDLVGISLTVSEQQIESTLYNLRQKLPTSYFTFIVQNDDDQLPNAIAVLKTTDQLEAIKVRATDGANYEISNEDIIAKLRTWQQRCEFDVIRVGRDKLLLEFKTLPESICSFAEEVYEFCPDVVEQGIALVYNPQEHSEVFATARQLCPNLSNSYDSEEDSLETSLAGMREFVSPQEIEQLQQMMAIAKQSEDSGYSTSTEDGIRLLAYEIQKTKYLGFWWD